MTEKYKPPLGQTISAILGTVAVVGALVGMYNLPGNRHGASHSPGIDTMPSYPVVYSPSPDAWKDATPPPKGRIVSAWVCRGFVFFDFDPPPNSKATSDQVEVIVNPVVDTGSQLPLQLKNISPDGKIDFGKPRSSEDFGLYFYKGGKLTPDDGRLNRCYGNVLVSAVNLMDKNGNNWQALTDDDSTVHSGEVVQPDIDTALRNRLVHADYVLSIGQAVDFISRNGG